MRAHLIFPPWWTPWAPYVATPLLAGALEDAGVEVTLYDLAARALPWLASRSWPEPGGALGLAFQLINPPDLHASLSGLRDWRPGDSRQLERSQAGLDWGLLRVEAAWPELLIHRGAYRPREPASRWLARSEAGETPAHPLGDWLDRQIQELEVTNGDIVGLTVTSENQLLCAVSIARAVRAHHPQCRLALGGAWLSHAEHVLRGSLIRALSPDAVVAGAGCDALVALARTRASGPPAAAPPPRPRHEALDWDDYLSTRPVLALPNARGCAWSRCSFCSEPSAAGPFRAVPVERIVEHATALLGHLPGAVFQLSAEGDCVTRLVALARALRGAEIQWSARVRISPELARPEYARALAEGGCQMLVMGLESLDDDALREMNKGFDREVALRALRALGEAGIWRSVFLIAGWEGDRDGEATLRALETLRGPPALAEAVQCSVLRIPPSAAIARDPGFTTPPDVLGLVRRVRQMNPVAFRGATRELLLAALADHPRGAVQAHLTGLMQ